MASLAGPCRGPAQLFTVAHLRLGGDLLERALGDTDELQDLWLRFVIPFLDVIAVMALGDVVIVALPPHGQWWAYALNLAALQFLGRRRPLCVGLRRSEKRSSASSGARRL